MPKILLAFFLCIVQTIGFSQQLSGLQVTLKFGKDTFEFLEPWNFGIELSTNNPAGLNVPLGDPYQEPYSSFSEIKVELMDARINKWIDLELIKSACNPDLRNIALIKLDQPYLRVFECAPPFHLAGIVGKVKLRAYYSPLCNGPDSLKHYSAPTEITILNLSPKDEAAFNYLKTALKKPQQIYYPLLFVGGDTANITPVKHLLEYFPASTLADYANLHLSALYQIKFNSEAAKHADSSRIDYLRESKRYALKGLLSKNPIVVQRSKNNLLSYQGHIISVYYPDWPPEELYDEFGYGN